MKKIIMMVVLSVFVCGGLFMAAPAVVKAEETVKKKKRRNTLGRLKRKCAKGNKSACKRVTKKCEKLKTRIEAGKVKNPGKSKVRLKKYCR